MPCKETCKHPATCEGDVRRGGGAGGGGALEDRQAGCIPSCLVGRQRDESQQCGGIEAKQADDLRGAFGAEGWTQVDRNTLLLRCTAWVAAVRWPCSTACTVASQPGRGGIVPDANSPVKLENI